MGCTEQSQDVFPDHKPGSKERRILFCSSTKVVFSRTVFGVFRACFQQPVAHKETRNCCFSPGERSSTAGAKTLPGSVGMMDVHPCGGL